MPRIAVTYLATLSAACLAGFYVAFSSIFGPIDIVACIVSAVLLLAVVGLVMRIWGGKVSKATALVGLVLVSIWIFYFGYLFTLVLPPLTQLAVVLGFAAASTVAVLLLRRLAVSGGPSGYLAAVVGAILASVPIMAIASTQQGISQGLRQTELQQTHDTGKYDVWQYVRRVKFQQTPNVYLLGLSAATADAILKKHVGVESSALSAQMVADGFRIFRNAFTEGQLTRNAYDALLGMTRSYHRLIGPDDRGLMLSGNIPSPLLSIFKEGGYGINAITEAAKFGGPMGPFVDNYEIATVPSVCHNHFLPESIKPYVFFGACNLRKSVFDWDKPTKDEIVEFYFNQIDEVLKKPGPQFTFAHFRPPYHYRGPKFTEVNVAALAEFHDNEVEWLEAAAVNLHTAVNKILAADPNPIIFVFGDHGLSLAEDPETPGPLPEFFVQDRYAILAGIYPANICNEYMPDDPTRPVTTSMVVRSILTCLSGGEDPYINPEAHQGLFNGTDFDFADYVYE